MPDFANSDKPLEVDLIEKKFEFIKDWVQYHSIFSDQISKSVVAAGSSSGAVLYTVPENRVLYITGVAISSAHNHAAPAQNATTKLYASDASETGGIFGVRSWGETGTGNSNNGSINFSMPIKITGGNSVLYDNSPGVNASIYLYGFELDKEIL